MSMQGVLNWKTCKRCFNPYDIGTNFDICPACRLKERMQLLEKLDEERIKQERENGKRG